MIPEEDRGPAWLRDYGTTDFGSIEADIQAMEQFAAKLAANVQDSYAPHMASVSESMGAPLPSPPAEFVELTSFLTAHNQAQDVTHQNVYNYANGTQGFATAASEVSKQYSGSDAFSHARVTDVNKAMDAVGIPEATNGYPSTTSTSEGDV